MFEVSYAHQSCIYLIKNTVKKLQFKIILFYVNMFKNVMHHCDGKAKLSASLLQSSHDPSQIILI